MRVIAPSGASTCCGGAAAGACASKQQASGKASPVARSIRENRLSTARPQEAEGAEKNHQILTSAIIPYHRPGIRESGIAPSGSNWPLYSLDRPLNVIHFTGRSHSACDSIRFLARDAPRNPSLFPLSAGPRPSSMDEADGRPGPVALQSGHLDAPKDAPKHSLRHVSDRRSVDSDQGSADRRSSSIFKMTSTEHLMRRVSPSKPEVTVTLRVGAQKRPAFTRRTP